MEICKHGNRYEAVNDDGQVVAYIEKAYYGTHGHSRVWEHFCFGEKFGRIVSACALTDKPWKFMSVGEFKRYYTQGGHEQCKEANHE